MDKRFYDNERIKKRHQELDPNVVELCDKIKLSRSAYYDVLNGNSISPKTLHKVCSGLGVSYAEVIILTPDL